MSARQLIVVVEGTAAMGPYWNTIFSDYLDKIIRSFCNNESSGQKLTGANPDLALVVFNTHGPCSDFLVLRSGWTSDMDIFFQWLSCLSFTGGGFSEAAIAEGLAEALLMFLATTNLLSNHQNPDSQRHCILVSASNPHSLPTPVYLPPAALEHNENSDAQSESSLADAETVAKSFGLCSVSLSVISPKQLPKLRSIYNASKKSPRAADAPPDNLKNPQFLVLFSENFAEARSVFNRPSIGNLTSSQNSVKADVSTSAVAAPVPSSVPTANGTYRQPLQVGNMPTATVKVEPTSVPSMVSGAPFSNIPSISNVSSQGVPSMQTSSPSSASQEINAPIENMHEFKPLNTLAQSLRPVGPAPANVNILNNLSQRRQMVSAASIAGGSSIGLPTMGGAPMAMHMSNMISGGGMASSAISGITSVAGSGALMATGQVTQSSALGSFAQATSSMPTNTTIGISAALTNHQGNITMGQSIAGVGPGQGGMTSGAQIGQGGIGMNQNIMNGIWPSGMSSSVPGTMIPTPGISQQSGVHSLGTVNNQSMNMPLTQHASNGPPSQMKYVRIWEGDLSGQRQGQPVFICKLEGYRNQTAPDTLAADWPETMQIVRLISQDHMNNKQYVGKADFLVFRALNQHGFLAQLQEKKLCAVIQLPSQTLLISVTDKAGRLIGMLFPGDMVVFKPQVSSQPQQQQQQQQMQQQQMQQQQAQQLQQQQMMSSGMNQTFVQGGSGRSQIMQQGKMQQGPGMSGGSFLP